MKILFLIFLALIFACRSTKEPKVTVITIDPDGSSTVTTNYIDSTTIVHLDKEGERIDSLNIINK